MERVYVIYGEIFRGDLHRIYNFGIYTNKTAAEERLDQIEYTDPLGSKSYWFERIQLNTGYERHEVTYK